MGVEEHRKHAPKSVGVAVITVSTTRSETEDDTGRLLRDGVATAGHRERLYEAVTDDVGKIRAAVARAVKTNGVDVVILNGGTGMAPRDVTREALDTLLEKRLPGFGELFRSLSYHEIGSAAMLSRAFAGVVRGAVVFALPGSPAGARLALEKLILPELGHLVGEVRKGLPHD